MARRLSKLQHRPLTAPSKLSALPFSTTVSHENPQISTTADGQDNHINDPIYNLRDLLEQGRNETAYNFTKSLILSNPSSFSSPSHLLSLFSASSSGDASLKLTLSDMLLSICSESKMHIQVSELYGFMRQEGRLPSFGYVRMIVESLVESKKFDNVLDLFKEMVGLGFRPDKLVYGKVILAAVKLGDLKLAMGLFETMKRKSDDGAGAALDLYREAIRKGVKIDNFTCSILLNGLCKEGKVEKAEEVLKSLVEHGLVPGEVIYNTIVNGYCQIGDMDKAILTIEQMESRGLRPNCIAFNSVIDKFCELQMIDKAEEWVKKMVGKGIAPSVETYNILIDGYGRLCDFSRCFQVLEEMEGNGEKPNVISYGSLINCLCKDRKVLEAEMVLRDMMNLSPDRVVYNDMIHFYQEIGHVQKAFALQQEMVDMGIRPDNKTYNSLILGHLKEGKLSETKDLVDDMKVKGLIPEADTYNLLIKGHCDLKDFNGAYVWYREMLENGFLPNVCICNELSTGLRKEGSLQEAQSICSEMIANGMDDLDTNEDLSAVAKGKHNSSDAR
ncbi:ATPASE EXPRESSION PROTEIN 3 [Salix koriyanagi]|uniref:ATPASE EXPRESSION PROTEIN 3 n=1 Tax=Salix koriyanagi TaxID=2511006 RepID=A0A9Q0WUS9_9ROSI|nr:ATPASE EXPRESSION PROTEIN 3 [Salix koriyanagi]